jgi:DNA-binding transcriptional MerR regulator
MSSDLQISIGKFSQITSLSARALRLYDEKGLLMPKRDRFNNYRYYTADQIETGLKIKTLNWMGFSCAEIDEILACLEGASALAGLRRLRHAGWVDEDDLAYPGGYPGPLRRLTGVWVEEIDALFEDQRVVVVGGGDSAIQEDLDLAKFAGEVTLVHRRDELRACVCLKARAEENPKIRFALNTIVEDIIGGQRVEAIRLRNLVSGEVTVKETEGVLIAIGWEPNTSILRGQLSLDEGGFVVANGVKTSVEGVYVAGDLVDRVYKQVVTSCGSGCMAAIEAERYLVGGRGAE